MGRYKNISLFEGLNSLRFFAAFLVVMHHTETMRNKYLLPNLNGLGLFKSGGSAVTFFFVLSGFLITYLLLKENDNTGTVSIKRFYLKRVLRIWPLYFLLVGFGALLLPTVINLLNIDYSVPYTFSQTWYYFVFFLPGLVTFYYGHHLLEPLWSIGIEEVFYLIWAPLFKLGKKNILPVLLGIILIKTVINAVCLFAVHDELFTYLAGIFQFEAMAVGGLGAYFVFSRKTPLSNLTIYKPLFQWILYALLFVYLAFYINVNNPVWNLLFKTPLFSGLFICFLFLYLIIGVSLIEHNIFKLNNRFLSYLGEISYGIYMYHMPLLVGLLFVLQKQLKTLNLFAGSLLLYPIVFVTVVGVAAFSKRYFEDYFLKLKERLTLNVKNSARNNQKT